MGNLFLSFSIAIGGAIGLVTLSKACELDLYINKILPLIPILYAIIYEFLEHKKASKAKRARALTAGEKEAARTGDPQTVPGLKFERLITSVGVSFAVKFSIEMFLVALFLRFSGQSFGEAYGGLSIQTVGMFLRGEHPWLAGSEGIYMLALVALLTCLITGLWIGYTSKGKAVLEGVLAGAAVTVIMAMTNMLQLYRRIEEVTIRLADSMGYAMRMGFLIVILLQVLLYGLWSGLVQMGKEERMKPAVEKKFIKRKR
ncbi:MAG TPA: hypothetical protein VF903_07825 [Nitrospirota bacterium]